MNNAISLIISVLLGVLAVWFLAKKKSDCPP